MPSFTTDGPDIPIEVLQALEDGELVFFCGSGVSKPAGLPLFGELVKAIYECVHEEMTELEKKAFKNGEYDRVLTLLERRVDAIQVRSAIATVFAQRFNGNLEIHRDLLRLSRTPAGHPRLVTTNFDDLFHSAGAEQNNIDVGPRLRSPKPATWYTVVHLHGRLADQTDATHHADLVLTSEDFGQAYMLDGWATRFVVELFRNFTIVFVGYSLNDPVMRYMVDALAAARSRGEPFKRCYAFTAYEGETANPIEAEWEAKGVCAIAYKTSPTHHHLYETLKELADLQEEGLTSKRRLALRYAASPPVDARDPIGRLVTWALSDPSGKVAEAFASAEPAPSLGWLRHIEEAGLLGLTKQRSRAEGERNLLVAGAGGTIAARLSEVTFHLARWLARHLNNPEVARRVISNGCVLHPGRSGGRQSWTGSRRSMVGSSRLVIRTSSLVGMREARLLKRLSYQSRNCGARRLANSSRLSLIHPTRG
jgi:SIR2-like domain